MVPKITHVLLISRPILDAKLDPQMVQRTKQPGPSTHIQADIETARSVYTTPFTTGSNWSRFQNQHNKARRYEKGWEGPEGFPRLPPLPSFRGSLYQTKTRNCPIYTRPNSSCPPRLKCLKVVSAFLDLLLFHLRGWWFSHPARSLVSPGLSSQSVSGFSGRKGPKNPKQTGMTSLGSPGLSSQSVSGFVGRKGPKKPKTDWDDKPGKPRLVIPVRFRVFWPKSANKMETNWDHTPGKVRLVIPVGFRLFEAKRGTQKRNGTG